MLSRATTIVRDVRTVAASFADDECAFLAGAVAYQIFFALIPLLALVVGVLGFVYGPERAQRELVQLIRDIYPSATAQETRIARELVDGRALSLGLGVIGTILATGAIHGAIDNALAAVLGRTGKRGFFRGHVEAFAFVGGIALLAVLSFAVSFGALAAQGALAAAGLGAQSRMLVGVLSPVLGLVAGYVLFYCVYRFIPRARVPGRSARAAALVSAVLWEVAKIAFGFFTRALGIFSAYGPIAFAAGLLTWIYVTAVIILIGAEVIKTGRAKA
ncbi:MAG TPA: YihY/virulence factor BrkB family protein [Candidatus Limnocylindria bacterium]|nr:YihY/virulence factor BrkB family protein [Candidatus Limnocylindria bacterium]